MPRASASFLAVLGHMKSRRPRHPAPLRARALRSAGEGLQGPLLMARRARAPPGDPFQTSGRLAAESTATVADGCRGSPYAVRPLVYADTAHIIPGGMSIPRRRSWPNGAWLCAIHPSSHSGCSQKFAKNNALKGTKFIADSSLLASMLTLYNFRRG
jgi:hypothetical protein